MKILEWFTGKRTLTEEQEEMLEKIEQEAYFEKAKELAKENARKQAMEDYKK